MDSISEDIEMMETEDVFDCNQNNRLNANHSIKDFQNKRTFNESIESKTLSKSDNVIKVLDNNERRLILRAKRKIQKKCFNFKASVENQMTCVLDTNILLSDLNQLKHIIISEERIRQKNENQTKVKSFVIPWIVVQELDHLKTRNSEHKSNSVTNAIHFINEELRKSKGENESKSAKNYNQMNSTHIEEQNNDDKIINCCLKFNSSSNVVLISNDVNLCNKALINDLKAMDWNNFYLNYNDSNVNNREVEDESPKKRFAKDFQQIDCDNSVPVLRPLSPKLLKNKSHSEVFKFDSQLTSFGDKSFTPKFIRKNKSPQKRKIIKSVEKHKNNDSEKCHLNYDQWLQFKYECEHKLIEFIANTYKDVWEDQWQQMLEIDIKNTTLKDIIRFIRKDWFSFSDHFNRDPKVKSLIDSLHSSLQQNATNYQLLYKYSKEFLSLVDKKPIVFDSTEKNCRKKRKTI